MPVSKRGTKMVSYNEQDDDDDFISTVDNTKKSRASKPNDASTKSKSDVKQPPKIREEKKPVSESEKPLLLLESVKETAIAIEKKENSQSQPTAFSEGNKLSMEYGADVEEQDEPKSKRMKHVEEDDIEKSEPDDEDEENASPQKEPVIQTEESATTNEMLSFDRPTSRRPELPARRSSAPLGFPTSKINIPSPHAPRVGLSRKSATVKPLHPHLTTRVVHE